MSAYGEKKGIMCLNQSSQDPFLKYSSGSEIISIRYEMHFFFHTEPSVHIMCKSPASELNGKIGY